MNIYNEPKYQFKTRLAIDKKFYDINEDERYANLKNLLATNGVGPNGAYVTLNSIDSNSVLVNAYGNTKLDAAWAVLRLIDPNIDFSDIRDEDKKSVLADAAKQIYDKRKYVVAV